MSGKRVRGAEYDLLAAFGYAIADMALRQGLTTLKQARHYLTSADVADDAIFATIKRMEATLDLVRGAGKTIIADLDDETKVTG